MSAKKVFSCIRFKDYDYSSSGIYFVTINTRDRKTFFGRVENGKSILSASGKLAEACWRDIPFHFSEARHGDFVVMPEHIHGLIIIENLNLKRIETSDDRDNNRTKISEFSPGPGSLGAIVRSFKSAVSKYIHEFNPSFAWQDGYYDHIVRNYEELLRIQDYIICNPMNYVPRNIEDYNW